MGMKYEECVLQAMFGYCLMQFISNVRLFLKPRIEPNPLLWDDEVKQNVFLFVCWLLETLRPLWLWANFLFLFQPTQLILAGTQCSNETGVYSMYWSSLTHSIFYSKVLSSLQLTWDEALPPGRQKNKAELWHAGSWLRKQAISGERLSLASQPLPRQHWPFPLHWWL